MEFGDREDHPELHRGEAIIIHFTDGSVLGIDTGSNAGNLASEYDELEEQDFHVSFVLTFVPPGK